MSKVNWKKEALDWLLHISIAVVIALLITKFIVQMTVVYGDSMQPTLQPGNWLVLNKITLRFNEPERGDIVVVDAEEQLKDNGESTKHNPLIKRVIGVEGDKILIKDGKVFVNEIELKEDYINGNITLEENGKYFSFIVPKNEYYVMGDNRKPWMSLDSRRLGSFSKEKIKGIVMFRMFPFMKMGTL